MTTNRQKKTIDWMRLTQFIIFCVSCVGAMFLWYYGQQADLSESLEAKYVTKTEIRLIEQKLDVLERSLQEFKNDFSNKLDSMEDTNNEVVDLITDIRLTLARISN